MKETLTDNTDWHNKRSDIENLPEIENTFLQIKMGQLFKLYIQKEISEEEMDIFGKLLIKQKVEA